MYKTRFHAWNVKKYRVDNTTKLLDREVRRRHADDRESSTLMRNRRRLDTIEPQLGSQETELADDQEPCTSGCANLPLNHSHSMSQSTFLDIPYRSDNSPHQNTATSSIIYTPERSQMTSRPSSSGMASMPTPGSWVSGEGHDISRPEPLEPDAAFVSHQNLPGNRLQGGMLAPRPRRAPEMPRSTPQCLMQDAQAKENSLAGQIVDQTMGFSWPSTFWSPTPSDTFQNLMEAPVDGFIYPPEVLRQKLGNVRGGCADPVPDFVSPQPETWTSLCLYINILLGQDRNAEAKQAMLQAATVYQLLVHEKNDQLLSILNLVLANLFLHGKEALAAELLRQAQTAAAWYLDENDPIMVSIEFMIAMALKKTKTCGIRILRLRQVVEEMKIAWGESHRFCITAEYHLAWRLAMEPDLRSEASGILYQTQLRAEEMFDPLHMQTVALITTQARVLGHLGHHLEAERTMSEALQRICRWNIAEDYPYYMEAKRRHQKFLEELHRVRSR
jgi:hypothetical protein